MPVRGNQRDVGQFIVKICCSDEVGYGVYNIADDIDGKVGHSILAIARREILYHRSRLVNEATYRLQIDELSDPGT